jgi:hypothetical protein
MIWPAPRVHVWQYHAGEPQRRAQDVSGTDSIGALSELPA